MDSKQSMIQPTHFAMSSIVVVISLLAEASPFTVNWHLKCVNSIMDYFKSISALKSAGMALYVLQCYRKLKLRGFLYKLTSFHSMHRLVSRDTHSVPGQHYY